MFLTVIWEEAGGRYMYGLTWERDSLGSSEQRVCLFLLWASKSTNITDHEQPCSAKHTHTAIWLHRNSSCFTGKVATQEISALAIDTHKQVIHHFTHTHKKSLSTSHLKPSHIKTYFLSVGGYFWLKCLVEVRWRNV